MCFRGPFGGSDWAVGVQFTIWGFRLGGGGSDWVWKGVGVQNGGWRGFRLAEGCGEGRRVQIATFVRDQEYGKSHKSELNPLRPI